MPIPDGACRPWRNRLPRVSSLLPELCDGLAILEVLGLAPGRSMEKTSARPNEAR